jgi:thioesterase domain-containing protein/acyl carrier protein
MEKINPLSVEKQALLEHRLRGALKKPADARHLFRRANGDRAPLSFAQLYIWARDQMAPGDPSHNLPVGFRIKGQLDVGLLEDSFNAIVRRHEALRTTFAVMDGEPIQVIHPECRIKIRIIELDHLPVDEGEIRLQKLASKESVESFDLSRLPLMRVSLYKLGEIDHVLVVNLHHIIADGLSIAPLLNELDALYKAFKSGSPPNLPELPVQYADFAFWLRREFSKSAYPDQAEYWRAQMNGQLRPLALPFDRARPTVRSFSGANVFFSIPTSLVEKLNSLEQESGGTFFSIALALFQAMLHRYSGSEDMLILTPVSIRTQDELRPLIGNFLNLVPLRCDVSGNPTFIELLRRSRETTLNGLSNKDLPFDKIVGEMKIERNAGRDPMFQVMLQVLPAGGAKFADLEIGNFQIDLAFSQFDLSLHLHERAEGYLGRFEYSTDVFNADTVERLSSNFMQLLGTIVADPNRPIATLPLLSAMDRKAPPAPERSSSEVAYAAPRNDLEISLATAWEKVLGVQSVGITDSFFDLGGNSLSALKLIAEIEQATGNQVDLGDFFHSPTITGLVASFGPDAKKNTSVVVPLQPEGDGLPIFCICGVNLYRAFAESLGKGQPVFGVYVDEEQAIVNQVISGDRPAISMERLVEAYYKAIARFQPHGPYRLAGLSFGGILAMELADKMRKSGAEVALVFLLDAVLPQAQRINWTRWFSYQAAEIMKGKGAKKLHRFLTRFWNGRPQSDIEDRIEYEAFSIRQRAAFQVAAEKWQAHQPAYDFRTILFRASDSSWGPYIDLDDDLGWGHYLGDRLSIVDAIGGHTSIIEPPNVADLGRKAQQYLRADPSDKYQHAALRPAAQHRHD